MKKWNVSEQSGLVLHRREYWSQSFVEREEGEPEDGRGEPVEEVLQHLDGDGVRREGGRVDVVDVKVGNVCGKCVVFVVSCPCSSLHVHSVLC